jgi:NAD(P)H dehydrogenase (quinone)
MTIAITGATGQLGRLVVELLKTKVPASEIVALVRTPAKAADLGVTVREGDYSRPDTLQESLRGVDVLLFISSNDMGNRLVQHHNLVEAAKSAKVGRIVYTSLLHADSSPLNLAAEHLATEKELAASGIPVTLLRNGWYTENYTASIPGALAGGAFLGSAGEGRISSAARRDFAEAAVAVLTGEGHEGKIYELAGDESYTLSDLAAEISHQTGKHIPYRNLPESEYAAVLESFGLPAFLAQSIASWDTGASNGALFHEGKELSTLIGRPTTKMPVSVVNALQSVV